MSLKNGAKKLHSARIILGTMHLHFGKCPKCEHTLNNVRIEPVDLVTGPLAGAKTYKGISYVCPMCSTVLSVGMDPIALKADTAKAVVQQLRKGS